MLIVVAHKCYSCLVGLYLAPFCLKTISVRFHLCNSTAIGGMSRSRNEWTLPYHFLTRMGRYYYWQRKSGLTANRSWEWKFDVQTMENIIIDFPILGVVSRLLRYCEAELSILRLGWLGYVLNARYIVFLLNCTTQTNL